MEDFSPLDLPICDGRMVQVHWWHHARATWRIIPCDLDLLGKMLGKYQKITPKGGEFNGDEIAWDPNPLNKNHHLNKSPRWFKVTFSSPIWRSLNHLKGHLTIPKRSQRISRPRFFRLRKGPQVEEIHLKFAVFVVVILGDVRNVYSILGC